MTEYRPSTYLTFWKPPFWIYWIGQTVMGAMSMGLFWLWCYILSESPPRWAFMLAFLCGMMCAERVRFKSVEEA